MQEEKQLSESKRGGSRAGAGRPKSANARNIRASFNLSPLADTNLRQCAEMEGCSRNDLLNRLLENLTPR